MPISQSIVNTATDALNAKLSAISVGYKFTHSNASIYSSTLYLIASQLAQNDEHKKSKSKNSTLNSESCSSHESETNTEQNNQTSNTNKTHPKTPSSQSTQKIKNDETYPVSQRKKKVIRRQCPLVNAGYAARISIVTCAVQHFITYHKHIHIRKQTSQLNNHEINSFGSKTMIGINLILLGGGMDALGVWATSLAKDIIENEEELLKTDAFHIHVYDLDCEENIQLKRNIFYETGLYKPDEIKHGENHDKKKNFSFFEEGYIDLTCTSENNSTATSSVIQDLEDESDNQRARSKINNKYSFIAVDLKDISSVEYTLNEKANFDWNKPTFVVSELVLSYLGSDATDKILRFFFSNLNNTANCSFIAYEPIGSTIKDTSCANMNGSASSLNGYTVEYNARFSDKLNRGRQHSKKDNDNLTEAATFEPLGPNCSSITNRFKACATETSFHRNIMTLPAYRAVSVSECNECLKKCPEVFDEHAAFVLHLRSYTFTIALSSSSLKHKENISPILPLKWLPTNFICNDENILSKHPSVNKTKCDNQANLECNWNIADVKIIPIETKSDDDQIRSLFLNIYTPYGDQYPSVRKMMKSALKTDLKGKNNKNGSMIGSFYRECGGEFWIGVISDKKDDVYMRDRKVIACLGLREHFITKKQSTKVSHESHTETFSSFEINRLLVDPSHRCKGIGRLLLKVASQYCIKLKQMKIVDGEKYIQVRASTPEILTAANKLYESCGYTLIENIQMGKMKICTHEKKI